ncbi:MAG: hypothetical protein GTN78_15520, partial [Gemmatimonadales bacterium]|nr:hypothetical protein [Gemmatimonadales bacterium]
QKINERMIDILAERSLAMGRADAAAAHGAVLAALPAAAQRVGDADRALADFKQRSGIITFSDEQRVRTERLNSLEAQHDQARATLEETEARLSAVRRSLENRSEPITLSTVLAENPTVRQIKADLYEKEESLAGLLQSYTEDHPDVIRLRKQLSAGKDRLRREVERVASSETQGLPPEYSTLVESLVRLESDQMGVAARERATAALLKKFRAGLRTLAEKEQELVALVREQQVAADLYTGLKQRAEELRNASLSTMPPVSMVVVDPPRLPRGMKDIGTPKYVIIAILAPILALLIGLTSAFVAEYFDDTIGTEEEVTHRLALPVLTSIPYDERPSDELLWDEGPSVIGRDDG